MSLRIPRRSAAIEDTNRIKSTPHVAHGLPEVAAETYAKVIACVQMADLDSYTQKVPELLNCSLVKDDGSVASERDANNHQPIALERLIVPSTIDMLSADDLTDDRNLECSVRATWSKGVAQSRGSRGKR